MNSDNVFDRVRDCIASVFTLNPDTIAPESTFETIPNWDSLGHLRLIMAVEEAFSIRFATEEIPTLLSVRLLCDAVTRYLG